MGKPRIGIVKEAYSVWERRSPFTPAQVKQIVDKYKVEVVVQPSGKRVFPDAAFAQAGAIISDDLSSCNAIFGVKQVPIPNLIPNKTYLFFSHVIKGQLENMELLDQIRQKNIRLIDYECITKGGIPGAPRLVAFGEYAGKAGMIDTLRGLGQQLLFQGLSTPFLSVGSAYMYSSYEKAATAISQAGTDYLKLGDFGSSYQRFRPLTFLFTGSGNVNRGARSVFNLLPHKMVSPNQLHEAIENPSKFPPILGCQLELSDMVERREGGKFDKQEYYQRPELYRSTFFEKFANSCNVLVNGIYWDARYPRLISKAELSKVSVEKPPRLHFIADISCDIAGGVEILERSTSVLEPFLIPKEPEVAQKMMIMGVDILPSELPKEASKHFGDYLLPFVPQLAEGIPTDSMAKELQGACIAENGGLRGRFGYIEKMRAERLRELNGLSIWEEKTQLQIEGSTVLRLQGHLFDTGLINQMLDVVEAENGRFHIVECMVGAKQKSTVLLQLSMEGGRPHLEKLLKTFRDLVSQVPDAEALMEEMPQSFCAGDYRATLRQQQTRPQNRLTRKDSASALDRSWQDIDDKKKQYFCNPSLKKVVVLGAGMVAKPCVEYLSRNDSHHVYVVSAMKNEASNLCKKLGRSNLEGVHLDAAENGQDLERLIGSSDVVVSLLPQTMHVAVAKHCIKHKVPLVTASYVSPEMRAMEHEAIDAGIPIICEMGLDPGMDHMSAQKIIDEIHGQGEKLRGFTSVCGGLPAPEAANNPFGYKFSWSPRGVLSAMQNPAQYKKNGKIINVEGSQLLSAAEPFRLHMLPSLALEQLPNRDSLIYASKYNIPEAETCFRGTLRYEGFSNLMHQFARAGMLRNDMTFAKALESFRSGQLGITHEYAMDWLLKNVYDPSQHGEKPAIDVLCSFLESKLALKPGERDLCIMQHTFNGDQVVSSLMVYGNEHDTGMARTVGLTVAIGADLALDPTSAVSKGMKGIILPTEKCIYEPGLVKLANEKLCFVEYRN